MKETQALDFGGDEDDLDLYPSFFGVDGLNVRCLSLIPHPLISLCV